MLTAILGFGFSTLVTTLMQIPYGFFIILSILTCESALAIAHP